VSGGKLRAGEQLKELRNRLGITTRQVEEHTRSIADSEGNVEFYISNAWLTQIENKITIPSIYKLYSLSTIYRIKYSDLLELYGVDLGKTGQHQITTRLRNTHLLVLETHDDDQPVSFPVRLNPEFSVDKTNLLSRMVETWGKVPISLFQQVNFQNNSYGYIGLEDYTLFPLLRPGSFVQIDSRQKKIERVRAQTEFDRPIYFVELREGYACAWCELQGNQLMLLPHPFSHCCVRQFVYPTEAEVVGRVIAVAMRIVEAPASNYEPPKLYKHSAGAMR